MAPIDPLSESRRRQMRRRRRPRPATAIALVALATRIAAVVHGARPPPLKKAPRKNLHPNGGGGKKKNGKHHHPTQIRGGTWADAAVAAEGVILRNSGSGNNNDGDGGNARRPVIVQPENLGSQSQEEAERQKQRQKGAAPDVQLHPWPHPDTFQDERSLGRGNSDWAGEAELYGQRQLQQQGVSVEYYKNGQPMQTSASTKRTSMNNSGKNDNDKDQNGQAKFHPPPPRGSGLENNDDNYSAQYEQWLQSQTRAQTSAHVASYMMEEEQARQPAQSQDWSPTHVASYKRQQGHPMEFETWRKKKYQQKAQPRDSDWSSTHVASYKRGKQQPEPRGGSAQQGWSSTHVASYKRGQSQSQGQTMDYEEWLENQFTRQQPQGNAAVDSASSIATNDQLMETEPELQLATPLEYLDVVAGKQVILRPRLINDAVESEPKHYELPPMGSAVYSINPVVYYYDPRTLKSFSTNEGVMMDAPELALPDIVFDSSGHALKLEQLHAAAEEVFLEVRPRAVWGSDLEGPWSDRWTTLQSKLEALNGNNEGGAVTLSGSQSQDQLIVLFTVATMAVLVGALSAKRLRSRRMLESCMHPELDDEDWEDDFDAGRGGSMTAGAAPSVRYDKKFDVDTGQSVVSSAISPGGGSGSTGLNSGGSGFGALLAGRNGGGERGGLGYYGTPNNEGGVLHWRGDMEKFDV